MEFGAFCDLSEKLGKQSNSLGFGNKWVQASYLKLG